MFIDFRERERGRGWGEGRERGRERNDYVRHKHQKFASHTCPDQGYAPRPG